MKRLRYKPLCACPPRCKYCGARRRRDSVGHYCPTKNCDWEHGYRGCDMYMKAMDRKGQPNG